MNTTLEKKAGTHQLQWGQRLKKAREAQQLTEKDVAARLHLKTHVITLIETEAFEEGPPAIFMRGYIRSYGKLLNFKEKEIDEAINQLTIDNPSIKAVNPPLRPRTTAMHPPRNHLFTRFTTGLIVLVSIGLVGMWWNNHPRFLRAKIAKLQAQAAAFQPTNTLTTTTQMTPESNTTATNLSAQPATIATPINPSDPMPKELADKQATTSDELPAPTAATPPPPASVQTAAITPPPPQTEAPLPTPAPDLNTTAATTAVAPGIASLSPPVKKRHHIGRAQHSDAEQEFALPEAGLEGESIQGSPY